MVPPGRRGLKVGRLGDYHPADACAFCGAKLNAPGITLRDTVIGSTHARGLLCVDADACMRRRQRQGQMRLFGNLDDAA